MSESRQLNVDTAIIGGGVAALWTANVLKQSGQSICVLTNSPLGEGQSLAAQGVIHGGLKYAAGGKLNEASEALADMPSRWLDAMAGKGPVDLSGADLLCDHQILWSLPSVVSQVVSFFGSKAVRGRSAGIKRAAYPEVFRSPEYKGRLFRIDEPVVDPVSIIRELAAGVAEEAWLVDWDSNISLEASGKQVESITVTGEDGPVVLKAENYLLAAGAGNASLLDRIGIETPQMQLRPLHQLIIRSDDLPDFYSVCVGNGPKPPLVSTTHTDSAGRKVWYIGGDIAEKDGVARSESEQIEAGKSLFNKVMPWVDLSGAEWFTSRSERAEPLTGTGERPAGAFCEKQGNVLIAWPTKLALAPDLADQALAHTGASVNDTHASLGLPHPPLGTPPWDLP